MRADLYLLSKTGIFKMKPKFKWTKQDLEAIAEFHAIVKDYIKMQRIFKQHDNI